LVLKSSDVRSFYDRFGSKLDTQSFYEDPSLDELIAHSQFAEARKVYEFGCGTGRFAARLLRDHLPSSATYVASDLSGTMVGLASKRLAKYAERAKVLQSDGTVRFPLPDDSVDRVICTYVLDILSEEKTIDFLSESYRILKSGGKLCLASLTKGTTILSRAVSGTWAAIFRLRPSLTGGCRPILLEQHIDPVDWVEEYRKVVIAFGVPSEILVARIRKSEGR